MANSSASNPTITLTNTTPTGEKLQATYLPKSGMALASYACDDVEVIKPEAAGLPIGPHFCENPTASTYPNGIARYVPWEYSCSETQIQAKLFGSMMHHNIPLAALENQDFFLFYEARLLPTGLFIRYSVSSALPSVIGFHHPYQLYGKPAVLIGEVDHHYQTQQQWHPLPSSWTKKKPTHLHCSTDQLKPPCSLIPKKQKKQESEYHLLLTTTQYELHIDFSPVCEEECLYQIDHSSAPFSSLAFELLSARSPCSPTLTSSTLEAKLQIFIR